MPDTPTTSMREVPSYRNIWVVLVVLAAVTAVIVVAALLIGGSSTPDFNGYWQSAPDQGVVIRLEGSDGSYTMSGIGVDDVTLHLSEKSSSALAGDMTYQGGAAMVQLALNGKGDQLTLALTAGETSQQVGTLTLTRVPGSLADLDARLADQRAKAKESAVKEGIHSLQVGVQSWAVDHADRYPDPSAVAKDKALGRYIDSWPKNPYTGQSMKQSEEPGDFTYERLDEGAGFKLTGHFEGGGSFSVP